MHPGINTTCVDHIWIEEATRIAEGLYICHLSLGLALAGVASEEGGKLQGWVKLQGALKMGQMVSLDPKDPPGHLLYC